MPSPVVFFQLAATDPAAARAFYSQLFDWEFAETGNPVTPIAIEPHGPADFDPKGSLLQLPPGATPFVSIFVRVEDLHASVDRAAALGSRILVPVTEIAGPTHVAIIHTPVGHTIGLVQA